MAINQVNRLLKTRVVLLLAIAAIGWGPQGTNGQDQPNVGTETVVPVNQIEVDAEGASAMMRGPVHEAFAEQFSVDASPTEVINKQPPEPINELPPNFKPEGDNIEWISGYWGWDVESDDFIWVTGVWRNIPPDQQWVPGYWAKANDGWQWISGFWTAADAEELMYLPTPPQAIDNGPSSPAPGDNYFWIPGSWQYDQNQFAWQAGYWAQGQDDWVWVPNRYISTPSGCLYREGFWDYEVESRGTVFCPMTFNTGYSQPFRPRYVVEVGPYWLANLFVTPGFNHYCFGNYHGFKGNRQVYPWVTYYQNSPNYDSLFSYYAYQSRHINLIQQIARVERQLLNDPALRSQATVAAQLKAAGSLQAQHANWALRAVPLNALVAANELDFDTPFKFTALEQKLEKDSQAKVKAVRQLADQRRDLEHPNSPDANTPKIPRTGTEATNGNPASGKSASPGEMKRLSIQAKAGDGGKGRLSLANPNSPGNRAKKNEPANGVINKENTTKRDSEPSKPNENAPGSKGSNNTVGKSNTSRENNAKGKTQNAFEHLKSDAQSKKSDDDARALRDMTLRKTRSASGALEKRGSENQKPNPGNNSNAGKNAKPGTSEAKNPAGKSPTQLQPNKKSPNPVANTQPKNSNRPPNDKAKQPAKPKRGNDSK